MVLVDVVRGGADFKLRLVGDEVRRAYPARLDHRLLSEIAADMPKVTPLWEAIYRRVIHAAAPYAARVYVGLDAPEVNFSYAEVVCLPLGSSEETVDHLLTFAAHTLETS
jgi:6-pyruvoyl-tetrahydropterin synthase